MSTVKVKGREIVVKHQPVVVYSLFSDLRRFVDNLPSDLKDKVTVEADSVLASVQGMEVGLRISQRVPFSLISFSETGKFPFPFNIDFHIAPYDVDSATLYIELGADLPMMAKMMIGGKLQEMVDKITDQLEGALNGQMPSSPYGN